MKGVGPLGVTSEAPLRERADGRREGRGPGAPTLLQLWGRSGRNLIMSAGGEVAVRLLNLGTLVLVARYFNPETFGQYNIFIAYYWIAVILGNFGLDRLAIRELSITAGEPRRKFSTLLLLRLFAGLLTGLILIGLASHLGPERRLLALLLAVTMIPAAPAAVYAAAFQAHQDFAPPAVAAGLGALAGLAMAAAGVLTGAGLPFFVVGFIVSESVRASYLAFAGRAEAWTTWEGFDMGWARTAVAAALPYGLLALLGMIYFRIDLLMLASMRGGDTVGHYAAAFRVLDLGAALPAIMMGVLFPRFAYFQQADIGVARELYLSATRLMLPLGLVLATLGILLSNFIVWGIFSRAYAAAVPTLMWLMAALMILFWHAPNVTVLFSRTDLTTTICWSMVTVTFNVVANLFLIPGHGAVGAAVATVLSELLSLAIFTPLVCRQLGISAREYASRILSFRSFRQEIDLLLDRQSTR